LLGAHTIHVRIYGKAKDTEYTKMQVTKMNRQNKGTCCHKLLIWLLQSGVPAPALLLGRPIILLIK